MPRSLSGSLRRLATVATAATALAMLAPAATADATTSWPATGPALDSPVTVTVPFAALAAAPTLPKPVHRCDPAVIGPGTAAGYDVTAWNELKNRPALCGQKISVWTYFDFHKYEWRPLGVRQSADGRVFFAYNQMFATCAAAKANCQPLKSTGTVLIGLKSSRASWASCYTNSVGEYVCRIELPKTVVRFLAARLLDAGTAAFTGACVGFLSPVLGPLGAGAACSAAAGTIRAVLGRGLPYFSNKCLHLMVRLYPLPARPTELYLYTC